MELSNGEVKLSKPPFLNDKTNCIEAYELVFGRRRKKERKKWDASLASTEATSNGERKKKNWPLMKLALKPPKPPKKGDFFMPFHPLLSILLHFFFLFFYGIHKRSNPD
jgi:hypothetical protein